MQDSCKSKITLGWGRDGRKYVEYIVYFPIWSQGITEVCKQMQQILTQEVWCFLWLNLDFI